MEKVITEYLNWFIELWSKIYQCSVIDWIRYVEWKTVDEFIDELIKKWDYRGLSDAVWLWMKHINENNY